MTQSATDQLATQPTTNEPSVEPKKQLKNHQYSAHQLFINLIDLLEKIKQQDSQCRVPKINFITKKVILKYNEQFDYNVRFKKNKDAGSWNALQVEINPDSALFPIGDVINEVTYVFNDLIKDQQKFVPLLKNDALVTGFYYDEFVKMMISSTNYYISDLLDEFSFGKIIHVPCVEIKQQFDNIETQLKHFVCQLVVIVDYDKLGLVNKHMKVNDSTNSTDFFKIVTLSSNASTKTYQPREILAPQTLNQILALLDNPTSKFDGFYHIQSVNTFKIEVNQEVVQTNILESTCLNLNLYDLLENPKKMSLIETRDYFEQLKAIYGGQKFVFIEYRALRFGYDTNIKLTSWSNSKIQFNCKPSLSDFIVKTHTSPNSFNVLKDNGFLEPENDLTKIIKHRIYYVKTRDHGHQLFDDLPSFHKAQIENHKDSLIFHRTDYGVVTVIDYPYEVVWTINDILPLLRSFEPTLTTPFSPTRCFFKQTFQYLSFNGSPTKFDSKDSKFIMDCNLLVLDSAHSNNTLRLTVRELTLFLQQVLKIKNLFVVFGKNHYKLPFELVFDESSKSLKCFTGQEYNSNMYSQGMFESRSNENGQYESKMIIEDFKDINRIFAPYLPFMNNDNKYIYNKNKKTLSTLGELAFAISNFHRFKVVYETNFAKIYEEVPTRSVTIITQMPSENKPCPFSNQRSLLHFLKSYQDTNTVVALNFKAPQKLVLKFSPEPSLTIVKTPSDHYNSVSYSYGNPIPIKEAIEICSSYDNAISIMFQQRMFYLQETMTDSGKLLIPYTMDDLTLNEHNQLLRLPINKDIVTLTKTQLESLYSFVNENTFPFIDPSFLYGHYINSNVKYVICGNKLCYYSIFEEKWRKLYGIPLIQDIFESSTDFVEKGLTFTFFKLSSNLPIAIHIFKY